ncbi:RNA polymerase subunit sigma-70 [Caulobacter flavus]|uniref:RNA polymerase subunit sigma-70 n=1 Tax=Caulobacter flavus TaxID=1679497 RepID=A0A2N5CKE6_9CAUL|nr:sigma-70 family RNA polymerase sigma factor [Caulobacter flavus]AYV47692.1 RNA polymerase subunit sigma-70 [Caulobacter flavus]PLR05808.1 RNA polymerase subunit sigma-70 [Caulobacter flavus]
MTSFDDRPRDRAFKAELVEVLPRLRAFARSLAGDVSAADDLVQATLLKAWNARESYAVGTNMRAWAFMILRNQFYSEKRRSWREHALDQERAEQTLVASDDANALLDLDDLRRGMALLPEDQREALILVGAGGLSYDEAAAITGVVIGTVKSRVSRARASLVKIMSQQRLEPRSSQAGSAMDLILGEVDKIRIRAA